MKFFDTFSLMSIFLLFAGFLSAQDCPDFTQNNLSRTTDNCQSGVFECLPIDFEFVDSYEYTLNGSPFSGSFEPCGIETTVAYDVLGIGNYPINLDGWEVNGIFFSGLVANSPVELAMVMSNLSDRIWSFDDTTFKIESINSPDSLGWLSWTEINTGLNAATLPEYTSIATQTAFELPIGNNVFVAYNFIEDCADSLFIDVVCEQITDTLVFNIEVSESNSVIFDTSNLGPITSFVNECASESGSVVIFETSPSATELSFLGEAVGTEQACIVMCDVNGICDTTYVFVTVTDPFVCVDPIIATEIIIDVNCDEPGSIELFMQDETEDYQFNWDNNLPNSNYVFDLEAGTYTVTITYTDSIAQPCFTTATYNVEFDDTIESYDYSISPSCDNDGIVQFDNIGLTYTWEDGFEGGERFDLAPGTYEVTINTNNCEEVTVVEMPGSLIDVSASINNICGSLEGEISLIVDGGIEPYSYFWNDVVTAGDRPIFEAGAYSVTVTDAFGCTAESVFEVVDDCPGTSCTNPIITSVNITQPTCYTTGTILLDYQDEGFDYSFEWSEGGSTTFIQPGLNAGDYQVTITAFDPVSGTSCFTTETFTLFSQEPIGFFLANSTPSDCTNNGTAEYFDAGLIYTWSDGVTGHIRNDLAPGDYTVTVTTPNGNCEEVDFLTIEQDNGIVLNGNANNVCDSLGAIYLSVEGGVWPYTYEWSNGVTTVYQDEVNVGTYTITVTDSQGCTLVQTYEIVDDCPPASCVEPVIIDVTIFHPDCMQGGMVDVSVENITQNLTYLWSNGSDMPHQIIDLAAGNYSVTIFDFDPLTGDTCAVTESFVLTAQDSLGFFLVNSTPADCGNTGSAEYSDPSLIYDWSDGGSGYFRNDLAGGIYQITVSSTTENCQEVTSLNIQDVSSINISSNAANVCDTLGSIYLSVTGNNPPFTYEWSNASTMLSQPALDVGVYSLTVTDNEGCTAFETYEIVDDCSTTGCVDPVIVSTFIVNPSCMEDGMIDIQVENMTPNLLFNWSNGSDMPMQIDLPGGFYTVTISDFDTETGTSCAITESFTLILEDSLDFYLVNSSPAGCGGLGSAQYSNPTLNYDWSDGGFGHERDNLTSGDYTITVTGNQENCQEVTALTIEDNGTAIMAAANVSNVCDTLGSIYMTIEGGTLPYSYDWADLSGNMNIEDREAVDVGNYSVTITDAAGCTLSLDFTIVDDCPIVGDLFFSFVPQDEDVFCGDTAPMTDPIAESSCPGDITYDFSETLEPNCGNTNIITRTWIATDDCGNTASAQQFIFEQDTEEPEIVTPGNISIDLLNGDSLPNPYDLVFAEDNCGIVTDLNFTKEENITEDGYEVIYTWSAQDECGNLSIESHIVDITGGMIWPGDTDSNKVVNNFDVFNIGFAYGETGPTRMSPTLDFLPQYAAPWSTNGLDDVNFRHADTDGNGIVDEEDILAVNLNYDLTHNLQEQGDTRETFEIDFVYETVTADNWVHVAVMLGNNAEPIDDFYGAGFIIEYDQTMVVPNTAHVDFSDSWTGTLFDDFIALQKDFHDEGRLDVGVVRTNQEGINGSGKIGSFRFQLPEGVEFTPFTLTAREGEGVRADKSPYELETTEVIITNVKDVLSASAINIYPNPVQTELFLDIPTDLEVTDIQLFGTNGQMVQQYGDVTTRTLEVGNLPAGLYYLRILTTEGTWSDKVSIMK